MPLLANIIGGSLFGLAARLGQLGIQKRNLLDKPMGHLVSMTVFGYAGYWAYHWDIRAAEMLAAKRAEIDETRQRRLQASQGAAEE